MFPSAARTICRFNQSLLKRKTFGPLDTIIPGSTLHHSLSRSHRKLSQSAVAMNIQVSDLVVKTTDKPRAKVPASELKFGQTFTDHMLMIKWTYKSSDGTIRLFRPEMNMKRMNQSARRLAFPSFDGDRVLELIKKLVELEGQWIPTEPGHSLYVRPTIIGTGAGLGVGPPSELTLFVICSPVGPYYRTGFKPVSLLASSKYCRAWPGGSGAFKLGANYPTGFLPQMEANNDGYEQILWLFGENDNLTEVGTMNLFVALEDASGTLELVTPPLDDKILPGVTRDSVLELLRDHLNGSQRLDGLPTKFKVSERPITMIEMLEKSRTGHLKEVFGTGTAAIVSSVERIGYKGKDIHIPVGPSGLGLFASVVQREILGRQTGEIPSDWAVVV
ncbi:hypothetical protein H4Q26_002943 [Puccinia striiformis f. sp. tritici PST-130]|nr:hypothetical protein H4Q26_002943 [Puccinia striiformis f. sp. tritici PST-130]